MPERATDEYDIVFYCPWAGPLLGGRPGNVGGAETQVVLVSRALAAAGRRVAVVVYDTGGAVPERVGGVDVVLQRRATRGPRLLRASANAAGLLRALWPLRTTAYGQRSAGATTLVVAAMARLRRRRFVYSSSSVRDFDFGRLERRRVSVALFHAGVRLADRIVVQTTEQLELCTSRFGRRPTLVKSVAEDAPLAVSRDAFLWVGRLAEYKRPLAYVDLARAVPEARFRMVASSSGPHEARIMEQLSHAAAELPNLDLLDALPREQVMALMDRAVAVVSTSEFEGMPNVYLEGWARGVPALALSFDPDGVIAREGLGAYAGNPERLASAARRMWQQRRAEPRSAVCRDYVRREHSAAAAARAWEEVIGIRPDELPVGDEASSTPSPADGAGPSERR